MTIIIHEEEFRNKHQNDDIPSDCRLKMSSLRKAKSRSITLWILHYSEMKCATKYNVQKEARMYFSALPR